jgi:hypothetical protein
MTIKTRTRSARENVSRSTRGSIYCAFRTEPYLTRTGRSQISSQPRLRREAHTTRITFVGPNTRDEHLPRIRYAIHLVKACHIDACVVHKKTSPLASRSTPAAPAQASFGLCLFSGALADADWIQRPAPSAQHARTRADYIGARVPRTR